MTLRSNVVYLFWCALAVFFICLAFLSRDPNTIFRGNSLTSKCIDETMKLAGMHYLQVTLKPIIDEVWHCDTPMSFHLSVLRLFLYLLRILEIDYYILNGYFNTFINLNRSAQNTNPVKSTRSSSKSRRTWRRTG